MRRTIVMLLTAVRLCSGGDATKGKNLFEDQCSGCHSTGDEKKIGPALKGLGQRNVLPSGKPLTDKILRTRIQNGGGGMPAFARLFSDAEIDHLIAYLKTL